MINSHALLLYAFLDYIKEKNINKSASEIINNPQLLTTFVTKLNEFASMQSVLEQVDYVPIQQNDVQRILIKMFNKETR